MKLKTTKARSIILDILRGADTPLSSADIHAALQKSRAQIDRATIFRNLNTLVVAGLVKRLNFGEDHARFEIEHTHHHHLICSSCRSIVPFDDCNLQSLDAEILQKYGFAVESHSLEFFGTCKKCKS